MAEEEPSAGPEQKEGPAELEDIEALQKALAEAKAKAETNLAGWQRAQADFINYKRQREQEKEELSKSANATLITGLLPVLDDFERALSAIPPELAEQSWLEGIRLIQRKWRAYLEAQGLTPIKAQGEPFDPRFHEAIRQAPGKDGIILQEVQRGYMLGDRVLRPSKVIVGNGEPEETEASGPAGQEDSGEENKRWQEQ